MTSDTERRPQLLILLGVAILLIFTFSGTRPLMDTSEARYAETAREMAAEGHWLIPHLEGHPHLTKPPLTYWLVAVPMALFGRSEFVARLTVGAFSILTVLLTWRIGTALFGHSVGLLAGWIQLLAVVPLAAANVVTTDPILTVFETAFMGCAWQAIAGSDAIVNASWKRWAIAAHVFLGLAFLTKGPAGFAVPAAILVFALLARKQVRLSRLFWPPALLVFLGVALPWYAYVLATVPHALQVWREEAITNVLEDSNHQFSRLGYLAMLTLGALPGAAALPFVAKDLRQERLSKALSLPTLFLVTWILVPLILLSAQKTRLPLYVLPLYPPLSILCARSLAQRWTQPARSEAHLPRWVKPAVVGYCILALALKYGVSSSTQRWSPSRDFKPVAETILRDAAARGSQPVPVIRENKLGHGLCYYLNSSQIVRINSKNPGTPTAPRSLMELMKENPPPGKTYYAIIDRDKVHRVLDHVFDRVTTVGLSPAYAVYRLDH
ncbi:MAG: glycosyltransferase family 39 protein [Candidatus Hydrogenedentota bacterium]|nr:MAG: glycosyltransferase family 39 protein [Candidatus Hydrogenedentota bacterium]